MDGETKHDMPFATSHGVRLHYQLEGDAGDALVFVHGYLGAIEDWRLQIEEFSRSHRVLMLDNRGHGKSEAPAQHDDYAVDRMVEDTLRIIARVGFREYHLVGHSVGGAVAQEMALQHPDQLLTLTLTNTTNSFTEHPIGTPPYVPPARVKIVAERRATMSKVALAGGWRALERWKGSTDRAHAIHAPTLIICGDRDASASIAGSRRLKELIPHAELAMIAKAGHSPHLECPREFNSILQRFLRREGPG